MHFYQWCSRCEWSLIFGRGCCFAVACPYRARKGFKLLIIPVCNIKRKVWLVKIPRHKWTPSAPSHLCELSVSASRDVFDGNSGCDRFVTGPFRKSVHCGLIWLVNMTSGCEPLHCFHSVLFFCFLWHFEPHFAPNQARATELMGGKKLKPSAVPTKYVYCKISGEIFSRMRYYALVSIEIISLKIFWCILLLLGSWTKGPEYIISRCIHIDGTLVP